MASFDIHDFVEGSMEKVQFGIEIDNPNFRHITEVALQSEALGFDSLWIYDHFFWEDYRDPEAEQISADLEYMTVLSALAALTERIHVGSLCCVTPTATLLSPLKWRRLSM